jgi:hypothetical protein
LSAAFVISVALFWSAAIALSSTCIVLLTAWEYHKNVSNDDLLMCFTSFGEKHGMLSGSSVSYTFVPYCGGLIL